MTATIKDDFMQRIATEEAWKSLSEDFAWTEALLEKNCDKVDWQSFRIPTYGRRLLRNGLSSSNQKYYHK